jgi:hypothetical protein
MTNYPALMTEKDAEHARSRLARHMGRAVLKFENAPNNTYTTEMIDDTLTKWEKKEGFIPAVLGIDYDNTMKKEQGAKDRLEAFILQWKGFRQISQKWHILVAVNAQTNAAGLDEEDQGLSNFSGSVEKYQHSNCMLMLHGLRKELRLGLCRASWAMGREEFYGADDQVVMLRHLCVARPVVDSFWKDKNYKPKKLVDDETSEKED